MGSGTSRTLFIEPMENDDFEKPQKSIEIGLPVKDTRIPREKT
jgi:hypothetical protein